MVVPSLPKPKPVRRSMEDGKRMSIPTASARHADLRFSKMPKRLPFHKMRWPTSPIQYAKRSARKMARTPVPGPSPSPVHGLKASALAVEDRGNNQRGVMEEEARTGVKQTKGKAKETEAKAASVVSDDDGNESDDNSSSLSSLSLGSMPSGAIDLRAQRIHVQSVRQVASASALISPGTSVLSTQDHPLDEATLVRMTIQEELEEFRLNEDVHILVFPEYFSSDEKQIVEAIAHQLTLGCDVHETIYVYKKNSTLGEWTRSRPPSHSALARVKSEPGVQTRTEYIFVDVPSVALHGQEGVLERLELRRLDSGGGMRRRMLWEVAQLSPGDRIADRVTGGQGGAYAVQSRASGTKLAMFKPADEEKFVREGIDPGEGAVREEAAYVLDSRSNGFSGVLATAAARLQLAHADRAQNGAVQRFLQGSTGSMENYGMPLTLGPAAAFVPVEQVHKIALLDIRTFNTDRHPGNILLLGDHSPFSMVPIDHGCILPSWYHLAEGRFDWLAYPQCHASLSARSLAFIQSLNADDDAAALRKLGIREECVTTARICVMFLQIAAKFHRTVYWMGSFLQRSGCFELPSRLELAVADACRATGIAFSFVPNELGEHKSLLPLNSLSRRPPSSFFRHLHRRLTHAARADLDLDPSASSTSTSTSA